MYSKKKIGTTQVDLRLRLQVEPRLLIGGLQLAELSSKKAATFKVGSQLAESRQH